MPSVDRVGRYFPLTLALPLGTAALNMAQLQALWRGLTAWDDLARDALHDDWTAEQLEAQLMRHHAAHGAWGARAPEAAPAPAEGALKADVACVGELPAAPGQALPVAGAADAATAMQTQLHPQAWRLAQGCSWWQAVPDEGPARLWLVRGLPTDLSLLFADDTPA
jgi:type VI secretion system protein ImpM